MFTNANISFKPIEPKTLTERAVHMQAKSLSGGLTSSEQGLEAGRKELGDKFDPKSPYHRALGETTYRLNTLRLTRNGKVDTNPDEIKAMERTKERLEKTMAKSEESKPDTWYGKLGNSITTALRGISDSFMNFWNRHIDSSDSGSDAITSLLF